MYVGGIVQAKRIMYYGNGNKQLHKNVRHYVKERTKQSKYETDRPCDKASKAYAKSPDDPNPYAL